MSAPQGGLILCQETRPNTTDAYYVKTTDGTLVSPTLIAPIAMKSQDTTAYINIEGDETNQYNGAITFTTGVNVDQGAPARDALTLSSDVVGSLVIVGDNNVDGNVLAINGLSGLGTVYDSQYNPAVSLQPINLFATNPLCAPVVGNVGEIFRTAQAGVAASAPTSIGTNFSVNRSGWYSLQIQIVLSNGAVPDINVPITVAPGGVNLGEQLSFAISQGVVNEPYGLMEITSNELCVAEILQGNSVISRVYTSLHLFEVGTTYTFSLKSSSAIWNIGSGGQIKAELIAMC